MKAIEIKKYGAPEVMTVVDIPVPKPKANEALLKISVAGVNFADVYVREGRYKSTPPLVIGQEAAKNDDLEMGDLLQRVTSDDILQFGMIPELIGRLPVVSALRPLDADALVRVLTEPKNALVKQYQALFSMENAELNFTEDALRLIAQKAHAKDVGARGLRAIIEEVMLEIMYDLPEQQAGHQYIVTEDVVAGRQPLFGVAKKSA